MIFLLGVFRAERHCRVNREAYDQLAKPSEREPVQYFQPKDGLFNDIMMKFMMPAGADHNHMSMMMQEGM